MGSQPPTLASHSQDARPCAPPSSLGGAQAVRPARRASVYVPTFFTSEPQPNVADSSLPQLQRINRQTQQVDLPLYYNAYRLLTSRWSTSKTQLLELKDSLLL